MQSTLGAKSMSGEMKRKRKINKIKKCILRQWKKYDRTNVQLNSEEEANLLAEAIHKTLEPK